MGGSRAVIMEEPEPFPNGSFGAQTMKKNQPCGGDARPPQTAAARRRAELEEAVRTLGGVLAPTTDFTEEQDHIQRLIAAESAPPVTLRAWLMRHGLEFAAPGALPPEKLPGELQRLIQALAFARVFLSCTDHLSDSALYFRLWKDVLDADEPDVPRSEDDACHWDLSQSGARDNDIWLMYYASEDDREEWAENFPEASMPPRRPPPFGRDDQLPQP